MGPRDKNGYDVGARFNGFMEDSRAKQRKITFDNRDRK